MKVIFTLLILIVHFTAISQTPVSGGLKYNNDGTPVAGATISFQSRTDSLNRHILVSDSVGHFNAQLAPGLYKLQITAVGYLPIDSLPLIGDSSLNLGTLSMMKNEGLVGEVVVKASLPPVKQKGDTLEYNSSSFKVNPDANAEEMVKKMPGLTV